MKNRPVKIYKCMCPSCGQVFIRLLSSEPQFQLLTCPLCSARHIYTIDNLDSVGKEVIGNVGGNTTDS